MLMNLSATLRSLTMTPALTALQQAHRMAQRRLQAGGAAAPGDNNVNDFPLPLDIDAEAVATAIDQTLRSRTPRAGDAPGALRQLRVAPDGRAAVPAQVVRRLGNGEFDRGKRILDRLLQEIRARRVLMSTRPPLSRAEII